MTNYVKRVWENEVPNGAPRYRITMPDGSIIEGASIELLNEVSPGTPVNAQNLNHIEDGIYNAQETANTASASAILAQSLANIATANAATAQASANTGIANASAAQELASSAIALAQNAAPIIGYKSKTDVFTSASTNNVDITSLSVSITFPASYDVVAIITGTMIFGSAVTGTIFLSIDGVDSDVYSRAAPYSTGGNGTFPFSLVYKRTVSSGTRTIKGRFNSGGVASIQIQPASLFVIAFRR